MQNYNGIHTSHSCSKKITLEHSVDPEDVAKIILPLIDQEKCKYWQESDENNDGESKEKEIESGLDEGEKKEDKADKEAKGSKSEEKEIESGSDEGEKEDKADEEIDLRSTKQSLT